MPGTKMQSDASGKEEVAKFILIKIKLILYLILFKFYNSSAICGDHYGGTNGCKPKVCLKCTDGGMIIDNSTNINLNYFCFSSYVLYFVLRE